MARFVATVLVTVLAALLAAVPVAAQEPASATIKVVETGSDQYDLVYQAGDGQRNVVRIYSDSVGYGGRWQWLVESSQHGPTGPEPLVVGEGCSRVDDTLVRCTGTDFGLNRVRVHLGDGEDYARLSSACGYFNGNGYDEAFCTAAAFGGSGPDRIYANDRSGFGTMKGSEVYGGLGMDHLVAGDSGSYVDGGGGTEDGDCLGRDPDNEPEHYSCDFLFGNDARDHLKGGSGEDVIEGRGGNDLVEGGTGGDRITGDLGRDSLNGNRGNDKFYARDGQRDSVDGGMGTDSAQVDRGLDTTTSIERYF